MLTLLACGCDFWREHGPADGLAMLAAFFSLLTALAALFVYLCWRKHGS